MRATELVQDLERAQTDWDSADSVGEPPLGVWLDSLSRSGSVTTRAREYRLDWRSAGLLLYVSWLYSDSPRAVARYTQSGSVEDLPEELADWLWQELEWRLGEAESDWLVTSESVLRVRAASREEALELALTGSGWLRDQTHTVEEEL